jgi:hypothetical protein
MMFDPSTQIRWALTAVPPVAVAPSACSSSGSAKPDAAAEADRIATEFADGYCQH